MKNIEQGVVPAVHLPGYGESFASSRLTIRRNQEDAAYLITRLILNPSLGFW
jgi:hypothetical protein